MYKLMENFDGVVVTSGSDEIWIPNDPGNVDWIGYQAWLSAGNTPEPVSPPVAVVPTSVTRYQGEVVMWKTTWGDSTLFQVADALFAPLSDGDPRKIAWLKSPTFEREGPALVYAASEMDITSDQLDQLFIAAAQVK